MATSWNFFVPPNTGRKHPDVDSVILKYTVWVSTVLQWTNYHKLSSLKQHKVIIWQFPRSEVWNQFPWAKIKVSASVFLLEVLGKSLPPCFFLVSGILFGLWPFPFIFETSNRGLIKSFSCCHSSGYLVPFLTLIKLLALHWDHQITPNNLPPQDP